MSYPQIDCERCIGCELCITQCPVNCIYYDGDNYCLLIDLNACLLYHSGCLNCWEACPAGAVLLQPPPPSTPTGPVLSSSSGAYGKIKVSWNGDPDSSSYEIYRKIPFLDDIWIKIGETISCSFIDIEHLYAPGWGMYVCIYKVRARNSSGVSPFSSEVSVLAEFCG